MATLIVPSVAYPTIQSAIDAANPGDTISVAAGVYSEQITIDKSLSLIGAGADINPVSGGRPGGESVIDSQYAVSITASNVVFNGFEIRNFRYGITIPSAAFESPLYTVENILINYNWIHADDAWVGIVAQPGVLRKMTITNNIIYVDNISGGGDPYALAAIAFSSGATANPIYEKIVIANNEIKNLSGMYGIFAGANPSAYLIDEMKITCNHFQNTSSGENFNIGNILNGQFTNNVVENSGGTIGIQSGLISGNSFINGGHLSLWGTEYGFTRPSTDVKIINNIFTNEEYGLGLRIRQGAQPQTIFVNYNVFRNSGIGPSTPPDYSTGYLIRNEEAGTLDATFNWWDSKEGPTGNAGDFAGSVTTSPWITSYTDDPDHQTKPDCWPLSTFLSVQPGFWPRFACDIEYIGKTCFTRKECPVLVAQVSYVGGDGSGIPVKFKIGSCRFKTKTLVGGIACICPGALCPGEYRVFVRTGPHVSTQTIIIGFCCLE